MKTKLLTSAISLGIAAALALLDLTKIKISFSETSLSTMTIYPAAFFALLGQTAASSYWTYTNNCLGIASRVRNGLLWMNCPSC